MRHQLLSVSCALLGGIWLQKVAASCYYPDGKFPTDYIYKECTDSGTSACCQLEEGSQCLSNGLCYQASSQYYYRGGCSDQSWKSDTCFQHCKGNASDPWSSQGSYDTLVPCGDNKYCCYSDGSTCCNDDSKVFEVTSASVIKDLSTATTYPGPSFQATATTTTTGTGTSKSSSSKATSTESQSTAKTSKPANTAASVTASAEPTDPHAHGVSKTAVIAGAAGGVVVLIIAVVIVFFCVRRRYRKKLAAGSNPQSFPMSSDGFQKLPENQNQSQPMPDKSPRPVEAYAPIHSPAPPYQPPGYGQPQNGAVEIDNSYRVPATNQYGQPVFEAPAQPYRGV